MTYNQAGAGEASRAPLSSHLVFGMAGSASLGTALLGEDDGASACDLVGINTTQSSAVRDAAIGGGAAVLLLVAVWLS